MTLADHPARPRTVAVIAALASVLAAGVAQGAPSLGGLMAHSRDDIPGSFTTLSGNDVTANATLPFAVVIGGVSYTTVAISTNGWLELGGNTAGNSDPTNDCLPSPAHTNPLLAFFWDDMRTINTAIRYGTVGTAPGRVFIVDADIESNAGSNHDVTLQVQIHEGSNLVTVKYDDSEAESSGQTATIGYQGAGGAGATARSISCNGKVLDDNTPLDAWSIDLGLVQGTALAGFMVSSPDDIPGSFTTLSGNDAIANATIPFPVVIDGVSYTTAAISTNGWVEFGGNTSGNSDPSNDCLPSPAHTNPLLAAYWDDMRTINTAIRYGTLGTAPGRTFVIDYDIENNNAGNNDVQFQVQIHEGSNLVTTKYIASQSEANGQTATLGFQGAGGASATARSVGCNAKVLDDNLPDQGWSIDLGSPRGGAIHGVVAHSRDDLPGGFTTLSGNDSVATAALPFTVTLDGTGYTTVALSTNGWLELGGNTAGNSHPANTCLPNASHTNPFLAAYWDDTRTVGSAIRYGTVGSAGGRVFIADFELENNFGGNHNLTMQVQVHEGSNLITVEYLDSENEANGQTATVGWQGAGGSSAQVRSIACNGKVLDDNTARGEGWSIAQVVVCGDGLVGAGEACDLGAANGASTSCCTAACALRAAGDTCRPSAGVCDVTETCTGASPTCPADGFATGPTCRTGSGDLCDPDETCNGSGVACPADVVAPPSTTCRAAADVCDVAETCSGVATEPCPVDGFATGPLCRTGSGDLCDPDESCDGSGAACPADSVSGAFVVCRPATGDCDVAESCTGSAGQPCPGDAVEPPSTTCRPAAGACDVAETCDGAGVNCPADSVSGAFVVCRPAAGACDLTETCDGIGVDCPSDAKSAAVCRAAAGVCDVAESCDGVGDACPADAFASSSTVCRPSAGACDVAENCDAVSASCPADTGLPDGDADTVCDAIDNCVAIPNTTQDNNDSDPLGDACDPCTNIVPTVQDKAKMTLTKLLAPAGDDKLTFKSFFTSVPTSPTVDPLLNGARFLVVDSTGAIPVDVTIPGGAYNAANKEGWKVNGSGTSWTYKNAGTIVPLSNGITKVQIKAVTSTPGKYKIGVKGKNGTYPINTANLPLVGTIVIDVPFAAGGQCGEAQFPAVPPAKPSCLAVSGGKTVKCK